MKKEEISKLLLNLSNTVIKNRNKHLGAINLTGSQADCIKYFAKNSNKTIKDFSVYNEISHQTAQGLVTRLKEKKYLRLESSALDKRSQIVTVTEEGLNILDAITINGKKTANLIAKDMTKEEIEEFYRLLDKAYKNVKNDWMGDEKYEEK